MNLAEILHQLLNPNEIPPGRGVSYPYEPSPDQNPENFLKAKRQQLSSSMSSDFKPIAPVQNYVPEWKRAKMANDAKWSEYADRLKTGPLGQ